jgi:S-adenosylmethionine hydrolase
MSIITLLTDFGSEDAYVGVMKGVILSVNSSAKIIDISHAVDPQDLIEAAYLIKSCYRYFPEHTVHIVVVDPGVGSDRAIVALEMMGHVFLAPNNGVLTLLMDEGEIDAVVRVENTHYFLNSISQTFHGRDIFAPVGAHLSKGIDINNLGATLDPQDFVSLDIPKPHISNRDELIGTIVSIDRFGNCISNIDGDCLKKFAGKNTEKGFEIKTGKNIITSLSQRYADVEPESSLAIFGSFGYLELALNCGNASRRLKIKKGDAITLKLKNRRY